MGDFMFCEIARQCQALINKLLKWLLQQRKLLLLRVWNRAGTMAFLKELRMDVSALKSSVSDPYLCLSFSTHSNVECKMVKGFYHPKEEQPNMTTVQTALVKILLLVVICGYYCACSYTFCMTNHIIFQLGNLQLCCICIVNHSE